MRAIHIHLHFAVLRKYLRNIVSVLKRDDNVKSSIDKIDTKHTVQPWELETPTDR